MLTADDVLDLLEITAPPVDILAVAAFFGVEVHWREWPVIKVPAYVVRCDLGKDHIVVNAVAPPAAWRFKVAHEFFHLVNHLDKRPLRGRDLVEVPDSGYPRRGVGGSRIMGIHRHANRLAADLLMPERFLRHEPTSRIGDIAARYQVSVEAMTYRARDLDRLAYGDDDQAYWAGTDFDQLAPTRFTKHPHPASRPTALPPLPATAWPPEVTWTLLLLALLALVLLLSRP